MLNELAPLMDGEQALGLVKRLKSKEIDQALPAEMELGLSWAISKLGPVELEPQWYSEEGRVPDLFSEGIFPGNETIVEITALSDAALAAGVGMRNTSRKIFQEIGRLRRGASRLVSYYFYEENVRVDGVSIRRVCVPREFSLTQAIKGSLRDWVVGQERKAGDQLYLEEGVLKVTLTWNEHPQGPYNFHSSMPPEIRNISENYIYRALSAKSKQIRNPHFRGLKCVLLADAGSTALRNSDRTDLSGRVYNGRQIAEHFLGRAKDPGIDVIGIITARHSLVGFSSLNRPLEWRVHLLCRPGIDVGSGGFEQLTGSLPKPRREGYQSRQLHEQAVFNHNGRGFYLNPQISWRKGEKIEMKFSARALLDLLAGRLSPDRAISAFDAHTMSVVKYHLDRGETISGVRLESYGSDVDDDHIVIEFSDDPAARKFNPRE